MMLTNDLLMQLHHNQITFEAFARRTHGDYTALAIKVIKGWRIPSSVDREDVVQEMLLSTFLKVPKWREGGATIKDYVVFTACSSAKKFLHRNVSQKMRDELFNVMVEGMDLSVAPSQSLLLDVAARIQQLPIGERQAAILHSVYQTQCVDRTTDDLMNHPNTRALFASDRNSVRRGVYRTVTMLTERAQAMA